MLQPAWDEIEKFYFLPQIDPSTIAKFKALKSSRSFHTKKEGNPHHYCTFFLPYDKEKGQIYLGHHIKAGDWIPPGGHVEPGETPTMTAIREMKEELRVDITLVMLEPFNLSVKPISRPKSGCLTHYDVWYLVHTPVQNFDYLQSEYHNAGWFPIAEGVAKITQNPDFAAIIAKLM
ncbi:MAG: NUDIX domain-containing protein [bacterium]